MIISCTSKVPCSIEISDAEFVNMSFSAEENIVLTSIFNLVGFWKVPLFLLYGCQVS